MQKHTKRLGHVILFKDKSINKILVIGTLLIFIVGAFIPAVGVQVGSPARRSSEQTTPSVAVDAEESKGRATPTDSAILESKDLPGDSRPSPLDRDDPWWDTDWSYRKEITIDHTKVAANLVNFPVLISFASDADLATKAQDDGDDIVFINNATGTKLNHEIEYYNSTSGELVSWVNVTNLSSTKNTILYIYYGNTSCTNQENPQGAWDVHYMMVQHLSEASGLHYDSTSHANDGTPYGGVLQGVTGKIDGADEFDGSNDYSSVSDSNSLDGAGTWNEMTADLWVYLSANQLGSKILAKRIGTSGGTDKSYQIGFQSATPANRIYAGVYTTTSATYKEAGYNAALALNTWYHVAFKYKSGTGITLFINGVAVNTTSTSGNITASTQPLCIGSTTSAAGFFNGKIDEVQVSNLNRSAGWINTSYNTMNSPATFLTVGNEQMQINNPPVFGASSPVNGSTGNQLSFTWSIPINDPEGNLFSWNIQCSNGQNNSGTGTVNGTKSLILSGLAYSTTYKVWVNATDPPTGSGLWTRRWYTFTTKQFNSPLVFGTPSPANSSTNNPLSLMWSIPINDPEGNLFSWTIQCSNGQSANANGASNGTKSLSLSGLAYLTTYKVWVNATDPTGSGLWTRRWYTFTTKQVNNPPVFGTPSPANSSTNNPLSLMWSIPINDPEGNLFSWTIQCSNGKTNSGTGASNGTKSLSLSGLAYLTTYKVWVNATDPTGSGLYTRRWYTFTTKQLNNPPYAPSNPHPSNGSIDVSMNPDLIWTGGDPDSGDIITYDVYCGSTFPLPKISSNQTGTIHALDHLLYNTKYYWKVIAWDLQHAANASPVWSFTTIIDTKPPTVGITSPLRGFLYINFGDIIITKIPIFVTTLIVGKMEVAASATDYQSGISRVEFYLDGGLQATDTTAPYTWTWTARGYFFPYMLKVKAYDVCGNQNSVEIKVWKVF